MFSNVEKKLQKAAKVLCVVGTILAFAYMFICITAGINLLDYGGGGLMIAGPIVGLLIFLSVMLSTWVLYGFGEIIKELKENNRLLRLGLGEEECEEEEK